MSDEEDQFGGDGSDREIPDPEEEEDEAPEPPEADDGDQAELKGPASFPNGTDEISKAAGLLFPVKGVLRCLELALETRKSWPRKVELATAVGLAAVMEYMSAEVLELAGNAARDNRKRMIIPRHVNLAMWNDEELAKSFTVRGNYEFVPDKKRPQLVFYPPAMRSIVLKRQTPRPWKLPPSSSEVVDATVLDAFSAHSDTQSIIMTFDKQNGPKRGKPKRVLKTALPERQYTVECDDPVWVDMSRLKFHNPLKAVLKQVHPDTGIRAAGADYVNGILHHWLCRLEARAFLAAHKGGECELLTPEHLVTAIGECLSGNLAKHALSEMRKATTKMTESLPEKLTKRALLEMRKATKTQHGFVIHRFRKQYPCDY